MKIDFGLVLTLVLAIFVAMLLERAYLKSRTTAVAPTSSEIKKEDDSLNGYCKKHFPNAITV